MTPEQRNTLLASIKVKAEDIKALPKQAADELFREAEAAADFKRKNKLLTLYPETGPLRRELYQKHMKFFAATAKYNELAVVAANRVGKSYGIGGYLTALHLTGLYPDWFEGRKFHYPIEAWAAGDTSETTRDIIQQILLGNPGELGTGLIPYDCILGNPTHRAGVPGAVDTVRVRHVSGGTSWLGFKCFAAGTLVLMADRSLKRIEDVVLGDTVSCADGSSHLVSGAYHYPAAPLVTIETESSRKITVTPNHRMFSQSGETFAGDLTMGDKLQLGETPQQFDQISRMSLEPPAEVYCVTVDDTHELIANGFRVGNSFDQGRAKFQGTAKDLCIAEGELVHMADGTFRPIEQVQAGDLVFSVDKDGHIAERRVIAAHSNGPKECVGFLTQRGIKLTLTPDHKLYKSHGLHDKVQADDAVNIVCVDDKSSEPFIDRIAYAFPSCVKNTHDLSVECEHRYVVNGILVSNCWLDEESPLDVYTECLTRLLTRNGLMLCTFTPLSGLSDVVLMYLPHMAPDTETDEVDTFY